MEEPHDRGAIEPQSHSINRGIDSTNVERFLPSIGGTIDADQSPIVAEIVVNRGLFGG